MKVVSILRGNDKARVAEYIWSSDLQCFWLKWEAFGEDSIKLFLPTDNCCDMGGAIKVAKEIVPGVAVIQVYVGDKVDIRYERIPSGQWEAYDCRRFEKV